MNKRLSTRKQVKVWCRRMGLHQVPTDMLDVVTDFMKTYKPYTVEDYEQTKLD
jgi:hypothetical protein